MGEPMRVQRALARAGVASRRHAEEMILAGRVRVNGEPARIGQIVDPARDKIAVDDAPIGAPVAAHWLVLNKPPGIMTTRSDPQQRRTVFDLVPKVRGLTYVGRLDYLTEGVLLMTTDGEAANRLTHPSHSVERTYVAIVRGNAEEAARHAAAAGARPAGGASAALAGKGAGRGIELADGPVFPRHVAARRLARGRWEFEVTLAEGRTREVRRLCEALGLEVDRLVRTRFGPVSLGELASGQTRPLTPRELDAIRKLVARK